MESAHAIAESDSEFVDIYMGIVNKDTTGAHKDISMSDGHLHVHGDVEQLWFGIGTPHRALAWLQKYRLEGYGEHPVIRAFRVKKQYLLDHFINAETEPARSAKRGLIPVEFGEEKSSLDKLVTDLNKLSKHGDKKAIKAKEKELQSKLEEINSRTKDKANERASQIWDEKGEVSSDKVFALTQKYQSLTLGKDKNKEKYVISIDKSTSVDTSWFKALQEKIKNITDSGQRDSFINAINYALKEQAVNETALLNTDVKDYNQFGLDTKGYYDALSLDGKGKVKTKREYVESKILSDLKEHAETGSLRTIGYDNYERIYDQKVEGRFTSINDFLASLGYGQEMSLIDKDHTFTGISRTEDGHFSFSNVEQMKGELESVEHIISIIKSLDSKGDIDTLKDAASIRNRLAELLEVNEVTPGRIFEKKATDTQRRTDRYGNPLAVTDNEINFANGMVNNSEVWSGVAVEVAQYMHPLLDKAIEKSIKAEKESLEKKIKSKEDAINGIKNSKNYESKKALLHKQIIALI